MSVPKRARCYYVYGLVDPSTDELFYVGKGKGQRFRKHVEEYRRGGCVNPGKIARIAAILGMGAEVLVTFFATGLTESAAYAEEARLIKEWRLVLTNITPCGISPVESAYRKACTMLGKLMPFEQWMLMRERSQADVAVYRFVLSNLIDNYRRLRVAVHG